MGLWIGLTVPRVTSYVIQPHLLLVKINRKPQQHLNIAKMSPPNNRKEILASLRKSIDDGELIVGAGAGIGLSAKFIEQGGGDLIIIYNSGRYRMAGRGSLAGLMPYGNANDVVLEMVGDLGSLM